MAGFNNGTSREPADANTLFQTFSITCVFPASFGPDVKPDDGAAITLNGPFFRATTPGRGFLTR